MRGATALRRPLADGATPYADAGGGLEAAVENVGVGVDPIGPLDRLGFGIDPNLLKDLATVADRSEHASSGKQLPQVDLLDRAIRECGEFESHPRAQRQ